MASSAAVAARVFRHLGRTTKSRILKGASTTIVNNNISLNHQHGRSFATLSAGEALAKITADNPNKDVIRYEHKNIKWSLKHVDYFADALAIGLLENGLRHGDAILSWLPLHFAEQHILQFACSRAGFVLYHLDPAVAIKDEATAKNQLKLALEATEATCLISQEAGNDVNYVRLCKELIPETRFFDFGEGMPFFSPRFPHLRFPIQTGFDIVNKEGFLPLKHMLVPSGELETELKGFKPDGSTPLLGELIVEKDSVKKGKIWTNEEVVMGKAWPEVASILNREYTEVEGVGVVF